MTSDNEQGYGHGIRLEEESAIYHAWTTSFEEGTLEIDARSRMKELDEFDIAPSPCPLAISPFLPYLILIRVSGRLHPHWRKQGRETPFVDAEPPWHFAPQVTKFCDPRVIAPTKIICN